MSRPKQDSARDAANRHMDKKRQRQAAAQKRHKESQLRRWWKREQITVNLLSKNRIVQRWK